MTLKQATLLAIISIVFSTLISIFISVGSYMNMEFYRTLNVLGIIAYAGLLPFFILIYQKQKDEN